jgi:hypothetical protein
MILPAPPVPTARHTRLGSAIMPESETETTLMITAATSSICSAGKASPAVRANCGRCPDGFHSRGRCWARSSTRTAGRGDSERRATVGSHPLTAPSAFAATGLGVRSNPPIWRAHPRSHSRWRAPSPPSTAVWTLRISGAAPTSTAAGSTAVAIVDSI